MHMIRSKLALVVVLESKKKSMLFLRGIVAKFFSVIQNVAIVEFTYCMGKSSQ